MSTATSVNPAKQTPRTGTHTAGSSLRQRVGADSMLLIAALLWGVGNVPQKLILEDMGPFSATWLRCGLALLIMLPFGIAEARRTPAFTKVDWGLALLVGTFFGIAVSLTQVAFQETTATNTGFLINTSTVIVPVVAWVLFRQRLQLIGCLAAVVTLSGAFLMCGGRIGAIGIGDGLAMAAAVFFAFWMVLLAKLVQRTARPRLLTVIQFASAAILALPPGLATEELMWHGLQNALPLLVFLSVFSLAIGWTLSSIALQRTPAADAAIIMSSEAVFGAIASAILLGEWLAPIGFAGAALIVLGILMIELGPLLILPKARSVVSQPAE